MRARIALLLGLLGGCDVWWQGFINKAPALADGGDSCGAGMSCDLASMPNTPDDFADGDCAAAMAAVCPVNTPFCDFNTGLCTAVAPPTEAFLVSSGKSILLGDTYTLMATGDYNSDGIDDVAVSGVFSGGPNAVAAKSAAVEIYLGEASGGLKKDAVCPLPAGEKPVHLLTVPSINTSTKNDVLVATYTGAIYNCSKSAGGWLASVIPIGGPVNSGFKRLALASNEGQAAPDLVIRTSDVLFVDGNTGNVDIHRNNGKNSYNGFVINLSTSNVNWVLPYRLIGSTGDSLATTWDSILLHPGIEFQYVKSNDIITKMGSGNTGAANVTGTKFSELNGASFAALAAFRVKGQAAPSILFGYSQNPNSLSVLYGSTLAGFGLQSQKILGAALSGLMLPYAGDANEDGQDEIGIYTMALNGTAITRHLQLLNYKNNIIDTAAPIIDLALPTENFRAMSLNYLSASTDRRRLAKRRDLIALIENPSGGSRLLVLRPNLNYTSF